MNKIKKISLIYSLNFVPESFIVYNKNRLLQKHALPTIKISRVKGVRFKYILLINLKIVTDMAYLFLILKSLS